jgi:hypothetical protein
MRTNPSSRKNDITQVRGSICVASWSQSRLHRATIYPCDGDLNFKLGYISFSGVKNAVKHRSSLQDLLWKEGNVEMYFLVYLALPFFSSSHLSSVFESVAIA